MDIWQQLSTIVASELLPSILARSASIIPIMDRHDDPQFIYPGDHTAAMQLALAQATLAPPMPSNFSVGAVIVHSASGRIVATGHTFELPGNTHAEECCLIKLARALLPGTNIVSPGTTATTSGEAPDTDTARAAMLSKLSSVLTDPHTLYTTMEPCVRRLSGRKACLDRVLEQKTWLDTVCYGYREPSTFIQTNDGLDALRREGITVVHVSGLEDEILRVAIAGHQN